MEKIPFLFVDNERLEEFLIEEREEENRELLRTEKSNVRTQDHARTSDGIDLNAELSLAGVLGVFQQPRNLEVLLTLFQPEGVDYVHHITASPPDLET